ncbi:MAG: uroporphyrinogen decarboxylase family protein [Kiritimatiellia bacterium]
MNSRELVLKALNHMGTAAIPCDFGGTAVTGIHASCVAALRDHYGLERRPVKIHEPYQMLGYMDEDLKQALGVDVEGVVTPATLFGFQLTDWKEWRAPWGQELLVPGCFNTTTDLDGNTFIYPEGDRRVPPSGRMPQDGYFFDTIVRQAPIDEDNLDPEDNLEEFGPIARKDLEYFKAETTRAAGTGRAVIATFGGTALGDIALVPAPFLKNPRGIRDIAEWYISTAARKDYVHAIFRRQTEIAAGNLEKLHGAVGNNVDAVFVCGTDFGTQCGTFCSIDTFRELYLPYYRRINDWIHRHTGWKTFKHSCGAVSSFMDAFIEAGFDIINPVQCSAAGMNAATLKRKYGSRLTFWGGGVDTQKILPFGTASQVREQVLERCRIFGRDGGFVFNAIHNLQAKTPLANMVAMIEALREFNRNPSF